MDESRKQFEAWIGGTTNSDFHRSIMLDRHENGRYQHLATNHRWEAWQASREAIEIQTPDLVGDDDNSLTEYDEGYNRGIILCDNAIIKHGLKVKVNR